MHLLGGDEIGAAPRHRGCLVVTSEHPRRAVEFADAERRAAHVCDPPGGGIRPGVEHRPVDPELARGTGHETADEQASTERECDHGGGAIGGVGRDAARSLAQAFATRPFFRREFVVVGSQAVGVCVAGGEQYPWVGDQTLVARADVEHPQGVHRIVAGRAAQEHDSLAVGRHRHVARRAEREPLGSGVLAREGVAHGPTVGK
jgi:hypothetical protein